MTENNAKKRLERLRRLEAEATPGLWEPEQDSDKNGRFVYLRSTAIHPAVVAVVHEYESCGNEQSVKDFIFIAAMREEMSWLLDMAEQGGV